MGEIETITEMQIKLDATLNKLNKTLSDGIYVKQIPAQEVNILGDAGSTTSETPVSVFKIDNPYQRTALIKEIVLIPNAAFRGNGILTILINKVGIFNSQKKLYFKDIGVDNLQFPKGINLLRDESVDFVFFNATDGSSITLAARVLISQ